MFKLVLLVILTLSLHSDSLTASGRLLGASSMFSQNNVSLGVKLGSASVGNENYTILGLSGNYFVFDDISIGLGYEKWFAGTPAIEKVTVESTYFIPVSENLRPYLGVLYRRIFIGDGLYDVNAYGYRAGAAFVQDRLLVSAGIVQERYESRRSSLDDTETYAEFTIGVSF